MDEQLPESPLAPLLDDPLGDLSDVANDFVPDDPPGATEIPGEDDEEDDDENDDDDPEDE